MTRMRCEAVLLLIAMLAAGGCASSAGPRAKSPRGQWKIDKGWRFIKEDVTGASAATFDDAKWEKVDLPHTWNLADGSDGGNDYYRGPGWYRRTLTVPADDAGKLIFLRFGGATLVADVWVNGTKVGQHKGGFGAFCFDVTSLVHPGADNVIAVRVDNAKNADVTPLSGDFTIFGGLYRDVQLLVLDPLHISPLDDASAGLYVKPTNVSEASANVELTAKLRNASVQARSARVVFTVADAKGKTIAQATAAPPVGGGDSADAVASVTIDKPHLWNGRIDPYLYRVTADVYDGKRLTDLVVQPLALRYFDVDPKQGFLLNGKPYALHGVNRHQEVGGKGWAASPADVDKDYQFITEMGCTVVRTCHYQHDEYEYGLCDRLGLVVWAELAQVDIMGQSPEYSENAQQQLRELIKQNANHPSICMWSLWNEVRLKNQPQAHAVGLTKTLNDLAHKLDASRPTVIAAERRADDDVNWLTDLTAFNKYWGWYVEKASDWGTHLDEFHNAAPDGRGIGVSEYGAGASVKQHDIKPTRPTPAGPWHPEEWQSYVHEQAYGAMKQRRWIWGTMLWCMFDFSSDGRKEGDRLGINDKGLVTFDRKTRKDAFYYYKANWTTDPLVHIAGKRFNPRPAGDSDVKVYSNCDSVELFLGDRSLGKKSGKDCVFTWSDVPLRDGENNVKAVGERGGKRVTDEVTWKASPGAATRFTVPD